jgi:TolB-like protein/Tfp pilus assembly protein PilF
MSESFRPIPIPRRSDGLERLDSWKEIAAYLGREVRTVQGWEKNEGLPVHRHQHARQGSVYAFKPELDAWREARKETREPDILPAVVPAAAPSRIRRIAVLASVGMGALSVIALMLWKNRSAPPAGEALTSVVVLPFLDLSPQKDQEYFSDGLTEEIIDGLSRVPNMRVVARTTAFSFKGKANDIRQIGRQLNVSAVLEGSVRKSGDQLRITAQLNRVSDGYHLWSRTYDRQLRDVFAVQQEISQSISDQLRAGEVPRREGTRDVEAYALYQEGRYFFNKHEPPDSYWKAIDRYQKAIQRDPNYALAYAGMADAYAYLAENFVSPPREVMPKAKEAADKAVALDPNLAEAHTSVAIVKLDYEWDSVGAQREIRRAMELNPGSGYVHHWYAHSLEAQGRLDEATKEMQASLALDPLSLPIHWDIGNQLLIARKWDAAVQFIDKAGELFPDQPLFFLERAQAYYHKGDLLSASRAINALKKAHPESAGVPAMLALFGEAAAWEGRPADARRVLSQLEGLRQNQYVEPLLVLELCSALGDHNQLLIWAKRVYEDHSTLFLYMPLFGYLYNDDPGVKAFLAKASPNRTR